MSNWKIGIRVSAAFAIVLAICAATSLFTYSRVVNIDHQVVGVSTTQFPSVVVLTKVETAVYKALAMTRDFAAASSPSEKEQIAANINSLHNSNAELWKKYESYPSVQEEQAAYATVKEDRQLFWPLIEEIEREGRNGNSTAANQIIEQKLRPLTDKYSDDIQAVVNINTKGLGDGLGVVLQAVSSAKTAVVVGLALAILLAGFITIAIVRGLTVPLAKAVFALDQVADGDLTTHLDVYSKDEIGQMAAALNGAVQKLHQTMLQVADSAANASSSSQQLAASSEAIASGAQEQAASLEETSASLEQISAAIRESASNANDARELASGSGAAGNARDNGMNAVTAMAEITASSAKIADIIGTVDEIAFQTNLLAVNAAVEAARAGDEGRGFAVVATEVRSLAQRSSQAAKEIKALIQDSLRKVERGSELVTRVTQLVTDIATMSSEQSAGVEQVNTAMAQMDQVTQSNSAQTEELSATAEAMAQQAQQLLTLVSTFQVGATPGTGPTQAARKKPVAGSNSGSSQSVRFGAGGKKWGKKRGVQPVAVSPALAGTTAGTGASDSSFESF